MGSNSLAALAPRTNCVQHLIGCFVAGFIICKCLPLYQLQLTIAYLYIIKVHASEDAVLVHMHGRQIGDDLKEGRSMQPVHPCSRIREKGGLVDRFMGARGEVG